MRARYGKALPAGARLAQDSSLPGGLTLSPARGWPELVLAPEKNHLSLLQPPFPPLDLFSDLAPCKVELSKPLLLSLSSVALPSSPILTLVALSSTVSPRHTNHQGANFQRCEHASPRAITQVSSWDWRTLSDAYIVC